MTRLIVAPFEFFTDLSGDPLENGCIYIGTKNLDPKDNPINVFWDKAKSISAAQPIRTLAGYPSYNGTPGNLYVDESDYSITVEDKNHNLVMTLLSASGAALSTSDSAAAASVPDNRVISGVERDASEQPAFLSIDGGNPSVTILGGTTNLKLSINGVEVLVDTDIVKTGLSLASGTNNTCLVNDASLVDQLSSKYTGEDGTTLSISTAGSEITSRVGQTAAFQKNGGTEIMLAYIKSATELTNVRRGYFYDEAADHGDPIVRETLADGDQLNILSLAHIFISNDGITVDATYRTPVESFTEPVSPVSGDYWKDLANNVWKKYTSVWTQSNNTIVGTVAVGTVKTEGKREQDYFADYRDTNTMDLEIYSDEIVRSVDRTNTVFVYSGVLRIDSHKTVWNNTLDMETGAIAASTRYYLYLASTGETIVSPEKYYDRPDLLGKYHPYEAWRYLGRAETDSSSDWVNVISDNYNLTAKKQVRYDSKNLIIGPVTNTTVPITADEIELINEDGKVLTRKNVSEIFDITTDIHSGTEKASHFYQLNVSANNEEDDLVLKLTPMLTGTTDSTTAGKLEDSTADFVTDIVGFIEKYQPTVRNRSFGTETKATEIDDLNTLSLTDDIFNLSGTADSNVLNKLVDSTATFITNGVKVGQTVENSDTSGTAAITLVESETTLQFASDLFPNGNENYEFPNLDYEIIIPRPQNAAEFQANIGKVYNDGSSNLTEIEKYGRARVTRSRWIGANGFGSSSNAIRKFSTEVIVSDDVVATIINSATLGFTVTANMDCEVEISHPCESNASSLFGISKNSTQLTTSVGSITDSDRVIVTTNPGINLTGSMSVMVKLKKGDVLRTHTSKIASGTNSANERVNVIATEIT